jgi:hypothetical protein
MMGDMPPMDPGVAMPMMAPEPVVSAFQGDPMGEIKAKVDFWQNRMEGKLNGFNQMADFWRLLRPARTKQMDGFSNPQLTETTRATEAIATFLYRAMTSANPNFQLLSRNPNVTQDDIWKAEQVLSWQKEAMQHNRKLLRTIRSGALFGTMVVEAPWVSTPYYEGTDFVPRSLLQVAFDPMAWDISNSSWYATLDIVTPEYLRDLARTMPKVWDGEAIEDAIRSTKTQDGTLTPTMRARLAAAGYQTYGDGGKYSSNLCFLVTYHGSLQDNQTQNGKDWCVAYVNDNKIVRGHESAYRRKPFVFSHLNEFELEPYGYGIGNVAQAMQPEMNQNRGRMHDTATFSLFNMWIADRSSNIKTSQLKVRPWGVVEVEGGTKGLEPIRPQLEGINFGLLIEKMMKEEFRATTGATDNLQAIVTEASATEASIAQTEAVRRLSVMAENASEGLVRHHTELMHENNLQFLDQIFWIGATGDRGPERVFPMDLPTDCTVQTKIVTDKDFRPQRNKDIMQFIQIATSIRNQLTPGSINLILPFVQELARGVQIDPKLVVQALLGMAQEPGVPGSTPPGTPPSGAEPAMDQVGGQMDAMSRVRSMAGELGAAARTGDTATV